MLDFGFYNRDCMEGMKEFPDNYFDLAIVDPPYGIGASGKTYGKRIIKHEKKNWDSEPPPPSYFKELFRVSEKQIIFGGNYFSLPLTGGWIFWDKDKGKETTFSDGELAWTNFLNTLKKVAIRYDGFIGMDEGGRLHPTQKPVKLYEWLLSKYAKPGYKILDTHVGSASSLIACHRGGFDYVGFELDKDYYNMANKRLETEKSQTSIFDFIER